MDDKDQLAGCSHRSVRDRKVLSDLWGTLSELSGRALMCRQSFPLGETFERSGPQQPLPGDVAVFHFGLKAGLNPGRFRLPDRFRQLRLRGDDLVELLPNLAGYRARPARPHLAHVD
jgi:hypothetical protein